MVRLRACVVNFESLPFPDSPICLYNVEGEHVLVPGMHYGPPAERLDPPLLSGGEQWEARHLPGGLI